MSDSNLPLQETQDESSQPQPSHSWKVRMRTWPSKLLSIWRAWVSHAFVPFWNWFKKWAAASGLVLLGGAATMIQIDEYLVAALFVALAAFAFFIQIKGWKGIESHATATKIVKGIAFIVAVVVVTFFMAIIVKKKGSKAWSNLWAEEEKTTVQSKSTPSPSVTQIPTSPTIEAQASPTPAPTPSPTPEDLDVPPELILRFFNIYDSAEAQQKVKQYFGMRMTVTGDFYQQKSKKRRRGQPDSDPDLSITTKSKDRMEDFGTYCLFEDQRRKDLIRTYKDGDVITLRGLIYNITNLRRFWLEKCEIIHVELPVRRHVIRRQFHKFKAHSRT